MAAGVREEADVVVVGARVAGSPAATELARRGRKVIVLDAGTFPSDTLSTHVIFPTCVAELNALGALEPETQPLGQVADGHDVAAEVDDPADPGRLRGDAARLRVADDLLHARDGQRVLLATEREDHELSGGLIGGHQASKRRLASM